MTTTDTRAALDAAIDGLIGDPLSRRCSFCGSPIGVPCHTVPYSERVEYGGGEVHDRPHAARLGGSLHSAIAAHVAAEVARALAAAPEVEEAIALVCPDHGGRECECDCKIATVYDRLRAAIAADRARAVAEACSVKSAACPQMIEWQKTRPTPDEARRMVEEYGEAVAYGESAPVRGPHPVPDAVYDRIKDTEDALLRALGVES